MLIDLAPSPARTRETRAIPYVVAAVAFAGYAAWSLQRLRTFDASGFDLGIFEQAVRSYAHGHWPVSDLLGADWPTLGDHFHPILAVLAPFYLLWPSPGCLLVAQALLFALSAVPVTRCASRLLGARRGALVGAGYVLSWGLLSAVNFDFHEVCFAVPMLAFTAEHLLRERWRAAVWCALPLVLVKEDLPLTLAAVGVVLVLNRQRRLGWTVIVFGVATSALLFVVVLPALNPAGAYAHGSGFNPFGGAIVKVSMLLALLAPTAFAALRSPLLLLAVPTLLWRLVSANDRYWGLGYHYSAVLMPIVFIAGVHGARRLTRWVPVCAVVAGLASLGLQAAHLTDGVWTPAQRAGIDAVLARIPDGATVLASNRLAPHLTSRCTVRFFDGVTNERPEWVVVAQPEQSWPTTLATKAAALADLETTGYLRVDGTDSVVLLHRE
ncbi:MULTISPECIES: DUF2079 domain-containing protein [unclassified Amycolatopsis]|uniref:DUF2079 domain-containing protein n=1 Tax=unclassified Amycolatopsis TaxID=2618356 RepID=UPI00287660B6|nr:MULTISPECIES: DUF2079 domain-containing protein [unclassified Amycolatopsis]MDS0133552.1 DUF2079 domain-containing protein [Amycolatopsis sp. 505]MDS0146782.1 DUF2079 domain-containing protein [Amycolatopsis sp. CM201R]